MGFPRQEYWNGLPLLSPGDLPNPGIKPVSPALAGGFFTTELLYSTGNYIQCLVKTYNGKESEEKDCITESLCCIPEANTTL